MRGTSVRDWREESDNTRRYLPRRREAERRQARERVEGGEKTRGGEEGIHKGEERCVLKREASESVKWPGRRREA